MSSSTPPKTLHLGVLMLPYQQIDVAMPLDILSSCSTQTFDILKKLDHPDAVLLPKCVHVEFHHIGFDMEPVELTAGTRALPTTTTTTCPPLDILLVGGPDTTTYVLPEAFEKFVQKHVASGGQLWCTCTGALAIAGTGVLDGRRATVNWEALDTAKSLHPNVNWTKERWVIDPASPTTGKGEFRTAGGACAGMDMVAHYVIEKYGKEIAAIGFKMLDYVGRGLNGELVVL